MNIASLKIMFLISRGVFFRLFVCLFVFLQQKHCNNLCTSRLERDCQTPGQIVKRKVQSARRWRVSTLSKKLMESWDIKSTSFRSGPRI